ncbi:hypothetical protein CDAR_125951 [Caerostris darwini]|uniref:Uncharacterized protein n=1 Tax=Caerostris darwini TaxID=1538125 RepID=A0AAV4VMP1_9ARAC|nr:hypothetical protein CDAR_125951 [Caerostris darwini]
MQPKNAGGRTLKTNGDVNPSGRGLCRGSEILKPRIPLRILSFSSIDSKEVSEGCGEKKPRDAAPQNHFERKFKFFREKLAKFFFLPPPSRYPISLCGLNL